MLSAARLIGLWEGVVQEGELGTKVIGHKLVCVWELYSYFAKRQVFQAGE